MLKDKLTTDEILKYIESNFESMRDAHKRGNIYTAHGLYKDTYGVIDMLFMLDAIDNSTASELIDRNIKARYE